jgi:hypothetical protein
MALSSRDRSSQDPRPRQRRLNNRKLDLQLHGRHDYPCRIHKH